MDKLEIYIKKLKEENSQRSKRLNLDISDYEHTALIHIYNNTLDIIKELEKITKEYEK